MLVTLELKSSNGLGRTFPLVDHRTVIGRETRCDLRVPLPSVAMRHCELSFDGRILELKDLGSETGTYHNGDRILRTVLADEDEFSVGSVTFKVRFDRSAAAQPE